MTTISFEFFGEQEINRSFDRLIENVNDLTPAWEQIADDFVNIEKARFDSEGPGWAPLSPAYAARKSPKGPILHRTRRLRRSLTERPFAIEQISHDEMHIGSDVSYGKYHQSGTPKMPRRVVVRLSEADRRRWIKHVQKHLFDRVGV